MLSVSRQFSTLEKQDPSPNNIDFMVQRNMRPPVLHALLKQYGSKKCLQLRGLCTQTDTIVSIPHALRALD